MPSAFIRRILSRVAHVRESVGMVGGAPRRAAGLRLLGSGARVFVVLACLGGGQRLDGATVEYTQNGSVNGLNSTGGTSNTVSSGILTVNGSILGGSGGTLSISNATVTQSGSSGDVFAAGYGMTATTGYVYIGDGGVLNIGNGGARTFIGGGNNSPAAGVGVLTLSGSGLLNIGSPGLFPNEKVYFVGYGGSGTVYLNGGVVTTARPFTGGQGSNSYLYFDGGMLKVGAAFAPSAVLIESALGTVFIRSKGGFLDTNGVNVSVDKPLLEDPSSTGGGFTKLGAGTLRLGFASTYKGGTTVSGGTLYLTGSSGAELGAAATSGTLSLNGGRVNFGKYSAYTVGALAGGGSLTLENNNASALTLTIGNSKGHSGSYSGILSGAGGLVKDGSGTQTLLGASTFTGATTIRAGVLNIQNDGALGAVAGATSVANGAALQLEGGVAVAAEALTLNGGGVASDGALRNMSGNNSFAGLITLGSASRIQSDSGVLTLSEALSGAVDLSVGGAGDVAITAPVQTSTGSLFKDGTGALTLSGRNMYTGGTTLNEGSLILTGGSDRLSTSGSITTAGGVLDLNGNSQSTSELVRLTGGTIQNGTLTSSVRAFDVQSGVVSASLVGAVGLEKSGGGTVELSGANTFSGVANITAGALTLQGDAFSAGARTYNIGAGAVLKIAGNSGMPSGTTVIGGDGTLRVAGGFFGNEFPNAPAGPGRSVNITLGTGALIDVVSGATLKNGGWQSLGWSDNHAVLNVDGTFDLWDGNTVYTPALTGSGVFRTAGWASVLLQVGRDNGSGSFSGVIGDNALFEKTGSGTQVLTGTNTFTGAVTVSGGVLNIRNGGALGATAGATVVAAGAALQIEGGISVGAEALTLNGSGVAVDGALLNVSGANIYAGAITLGSAARIQSDSGLLTLSGAVAGAYALSVGGAGNLLFSGTLAHGTGSLSKDGAGTVTLSSQNSYSGGTTVGGGSLVLSGGSDRLSTSGAITVGGGFLDLGGSSQSTSGAVTLVDGTIQNGTLSATGGPVEVRNGLVSAALDGTFGVQKTGLGTVALSGANTFTGAVDVTAGMLKVSGVAFSTTARTYNISAGAVLNIAGNTGVALGTSVIAGNGTLRVSEGYFSNETPNLPKGGGRIVNLELSSGALIDVVPDGYMRNGGWQDLNWTNNHAVLNVDGVFDLWDGNTVYTPALTGAGTLLIGNNSSRLLQVGRDDGSGTFNGVIGGKIQLQKVGGGTQVLTGSNSYTGQTTVSGGVLKIQNGSALGNASGATVVASGGALQIAGGIAVGAEALTLNGSGVSADGALRNVSGINSYGGTITLGSAARIQSDSGSLTLSGALSGAYALSVGGAGNLFFSGSLGIGTGSLSKDGEGTVTLSLQSSYTGGTTVGAGSLVLNGGSNALSPSGAITVAGGVLELGGGRQLSAGTIRFSGGTVQNGTLTATGRAFDGQGGTVSAVLGGTFGLNKTTTGWLSLSGLNTYTGTTTVSAGSLLLSGGDNRLALGGSIAVAGGVLDLGGYSQSISGLVSLSGGAIQNGTLTATANAFEVKEGLVGAILAGGQALNKSTVGTVVLSATNLYTGGTNVNEGSLLLRGGSDRLSSGGSITITGGVLDLGGYSQSSAGVVSVAGGTLQNGFLLATARAFDLRAGNVSAILSGTQGANKATAGALTLSGANSYTGGTVLAEGSLLLSGGDNRLSTSGSISVTGGVLDLGGYTQSSAGVISLTGGTLQNGVLNATGGSFELQSGSVGVLLSGTQALRKTDTGILVLSEANTYSGGTNIGAGTVRLSGSGAFGPGALALSGASLFTDSGGTYQMANALSLSGTVGLGESAAAETQLFTGATALASDTTLLVPGTVIVSAAVGGSYGLTKAGTGLLTLSGTNNFSGGITLLAGRLDLNSGRATGTGTLTIGASTTLGNSSGAGVTLANHNAQAWNGNFSYAGNGDLSLGNGAVRLGANVTVDIVERQLTVGGVIGGAYSLTKAGGGVLTLGGANTFSGGVTLSSGTLNLNSSNALGATSVFTIASGVLDNASGNALTLAGNHTQSWAGDFTFKGTNSLHLGNGAVTLTGNRTVTVAAGGLTVGGGISGGYALTKDGDGELTLGGANTYSGATTLLAGVLNLGSASALGTGNLLTIAGGTLDNTSGAALTLPGNRSQIWSGDFVFKGSASLDLGTGAVTLTGDRTVTVTASVLVEGGDISGAHTLTKAGSGVLTLSGNNSFSGGLTLSAGTLNINSASALGAAQSVFRINGGNLDNTSGADLVLSRNNAQIWAGDFAFRGTNLLDTGSGAVTLTGARTVTVSGGTLAVGGNIGGAYDLTKIGAGTMVLKGANTFTGLLTISAGTLQIGTGGGAGGLSPLSPVVNMSTLVFNRSGVVTQGTDFGTTISGTGTLIQAGSGTLVLTNANTYTGETLIKGGTLQIGEGGTSGGIAAASALTNLGTLAFKRSDTLTQGLDFAPAITGTGALWQTGAGRLVLTGINTYSGATLIDSGVLQLGNGGTAGALSTSSLITNNGVLAFNRSNTLTQGIDFAPAIGGTGLVRQIGSGTLILSGVNSYAGGTELAAGRLNLGSPGALGGGALTIAGGALDNASGAALVLSTNNPQVWSGDFTFIGTHSLDLGTGAVVLQSNRVVTVNAGTLTVGGTISGGYSLTKVGAGTLRLDGRNTFSGVTSVTAGALLLTNSNALESSAYDTDGAGTLTFGPGVNEPVFGGLTGSGGFAPGSAVTKLTLSPGAGVTQTYSGVLAGSLSLVKGGAGAQILTGASTYTGATTVSEGMLKLAGSASLYANTALSIAAGARFVYAPVSTSIAAGTLHVGSLSMGAGGVLGVKWGRSVAVATAPSLSGTVKLNMQGAYSSGLDYTVLTAPSGLDTQAYVLTGVSDYSYTVTRTPGSVVVRPTLVNGLATAYWVGGVVTGDGLTWTSGNFTVDGSFNSIPGTSNWTVDPQGNTATNLIPGTTTEVYITNLASAGSLNMFADADMALKGLTVTASHSVSLTNLGASTLDLGVSGISVSGTAGAVRLDPAIALTDSQTWRNESAHELVLSGVVDTGTAAFGLTIAGAGNVALRGALTGGGSLTMSGAGTLTLSGVNTYTGETRVLSGTLRIGSGGAGGSLTKTASLLNNGALVFDQTDDYGGSMNLVISGTGSLSVWNGLLRLSAANSYTGGTILRGGRLVLEGANDRLSTGGSISVTAGVLDLGAHSQATSGGLFLAGGTLENGILVGTGGGFIGESGLVTAVLAGGVALEKRGDALLTLSGANTYTGGTNVKAGTLLLAGMDNRLPVGGSLALTGGVLDLGGRKQEIAGVLLLAGGTVQNGVLLATGRSIDGQSGEVSAVLGGGYSLEKTGPGILALSGANTYTGGTNVFQGTLLLTGGANRLPQDGAVTLNAGILDLGGNSHSTSGRITLLGGTVRNGILTATGTAFVVESGVVSAVLAGPQGLVKEGAGLLSLSAVNTYTGGTTLNAGSLQLLVGDDRLSLVGDISANAGVLDLGGYAQSTRGVVTFAGASVQNGTLTALSSSFVAKAGVVSAVLAGTQGLTKSGAGTLRLSAANSYSGGTVVAEGSLLLVGGDDRLATAGSLTTLGGLLDLDGYSQSLLGSITFAGGAVQNGTLIATGTSFIGRAGVVQARLSGAQGFLKQGAGTLTLGAANTYTGATTVEDGTLLLSGGSDRLSTAGAITAAGGVLDLGGNGQTSVGVVTFAGGVVKNGVLTAAGTAFVALSGTVDAVLSGSQGLVQSGAGTTRLTAANDYTGGTRIEGGSLVLSGGDNRLSTAGSITATDGVLDLGGGSQRTSGAITLAGGWVRNGILTATGTAFTAQSGTVSAVLAGAFGLVKDGTGALTLSGPNSYSDGTILNDGMLLLAGGSDRLSTVGSLTITGGVLDLGGNRQATSGSVSFGGGTVRNGEITATGMAFAAEAGRVDAVLSGSQALVKDGLGRFVLGGTNSYTGGTTVRNGTLSLEGGENRLSLAGDITTEGGVLDLGGNRQQTSGTVTFRGGVIRNGSLAAAGPAFLAESGTVSAVLSGALGLLKSGPGIFNLTAGNLYTGETRVLGGTLLLSGGDDRLPVAAALVIRGGGLDLGGYTQNTSGTITLGGGVVENGVLNATGASFAAESGTIHAVLGGGFGLVKTGPGTLTLGAANSFTGGTTILDGTLEFVGGSDRLSRVGAITLSGGVLDLGGLSQSTSGLITLAGGEVRNGTLHEIGAGLVLEAGTVSAVLSGTYGVTKTTGGVLRLSAVNTYTGGTTVAAGILALEGGDDRLLATGDLRVEGGVLDLGGNSQSIAGLLRLDGGSVRNGTLVAIGQAFDGRSGNVSAVLGGTQALVKAGSGTLSLSGANLYEGGTTLLAGTLLLTGGDDRLPVTGDVRIQGGVLDLGNQTQTSSGWVSLDGGEVRGGTLGATMQAFDGRAGSVSAVLGGTQALVKSGTGTLRLSGVNQYTGGTTILAGTLVLAGGDNRLSLSGPITSGGGVLDLGGNSQRTSGLITLDGGTVQGGSLIATGAAFDARAGSVSAVLGGTQALVKSGSGTLSLSGVNQYSGGTTVLDGTLLLTGGDNRLSLSGPITSGGGVLDLGGSSQRTSGLITLDGGTVQGGSLIATAAAFDARAGSVTAVLGGTQALLKSGSGALSLSGVNQYTGGTTVSDGVLSLAGGNDRLSLVGAITTSGGVLDLGGNSQSSAGLITLDGGTVQGGSLIATGAAFDGRAGNITAVLGGAQALVKSGFGTLSLSGVNQYTGGTTVSDGALSLAGGNDRLFSGGAITMNGGVLDLGGNSQRTSGLITLDGGTVQGGSLIATGAAFDARAGSVSAVLGGTQALVKSGSGTLSLSGVNQYTRGTTVSDGTLLLAGGDDRLQSAGALTLGGGVLDLGGNRQSTSGTILLSGAAVRNGTLAALGSAFDGRAGDISASLSGVQGLVKSGVGTLLLSGENTYLGGTQLNDGILVLAGGDDRLAQTGAITSNGGVLDLGGNQQHTSGAVVFAGGVVQNGTLTAVGSWFDARSGLVSGVLSGALGLNKTTDGVLTLGGNNTLAGGVSLHAGQLNLNAPGDASGSSLGVGLFTINGGSIANTSGAALTLGTDNPQAWNGDFTFAPGSDLHLGDGMVSLTGNRSVTVSSGTLSVGGAVNGFGSGITKLGGGVLRLTGSSTYDGATRILAGELQLAAGSNTLSSSGAIRASGGTLSLSGGIQTTSGTVVFDGGEVKDGTLVVTASAFDARSGTVSAVLGGTQALVKSGSGALHLSGDNTFSGGVLLQDGLLNLGGKGGALASPLGVGTLTITGGSFANTSGSATTLATANLQNWDGDFAFAGGADLHLGTGAVSLGGDRIVSVLSHTLTVGGAVGGAGFGLKKQGEGTLVLTAASSYSGGTTVGAGSLVLSGGSDRLSSAGAITTLGGVLDLGGNMQTTSGTIRFAGGTVQNGTLTAVSVSFAGEEGVVRTQLSGSQGLVKNGQGNLELRGVNTFLGPVQLNSGTVSLYGGLALDDSVGVVLASGGNLSLWADETIGSFTGTGLLSLNTYTLTIGSPLDAVFSGAITGSGTVAKQGAGTLTLDGHSPDFTGVLSVSSGTVALDAGQPLGGALVQLGPQGSLKLLSSGTLGALSGAGKVLLAGANLTLGGTQSTVLTGTISGQGGIFKDGSGELILSGTNTFSGGLTLRGGAIRIGGASALGAGTLYLYGGTLSAGDALTDRLIPNPVVAAGTVTLGDAARTALLTLSGPVLLEGTAFWKVESPVYLSGNMTESVVSGLTKSGAGVLTLGAGNFYSGGTTVAEGTLLLAPGNGALPAGSALALEGGVLDLGGNTQVTGGQVTLGGGLLKNGTLQVAGPVIDAQAGTVDARITGGAELVKTTGGLLTLLQPAYFTGGATVRDGTLALFGGSNLLSVTGSLNAAGGVLDLGGNSQTTSGSIRLTGGTVQNGVLTATGGPFDLQAGFVQAVLAGTQGVVKSSAGVVTMTAQNTYTGATEVTAGTLSVSGSGSLPTSTLLSVSNTARFDFLPTVSGTLLVAGVTLDPGSALGLVWGSPVSASGSASAAGSVIIDLAGVYTSGQRYTILAGGPASQLDLATYKITGAVGFDYSISASAGSLSLIPLTPSPSGALYWQGGRDGSNPKAWNVSNWVADPQASVFTARTPSAATTVYLSAQGVGAGAQSDMKLGAATSIAGLVHNASSAASIADEGYLLRVGSAGISVEPGAGALTLATAIGLAGSQTWTNSGQGVLALGGSVDLGGGTLTVSGNAPVEIAGPVVGVGGLRLNSSAVTRLNGANTYAGWTTVSAGTLVLNGGADTLATGGSLWVEGGSLNLGGNSQRLSGAVVFAGGSVTNGTLHSLSAAIDARSGALGVVLTGSQALVKTTDGTVTLSALNTHSGGTTLAQGRLNIHSGGNASASALGTGTLVITGGTLGNTSGAEIVLHTQNRQLWNGDFSFNGPSDLNLGQGPVFLGSDRLVTVTTGTLSVLGLVSGGGFGLSKEGGGTLRLAAGYSFSGPTNIRAGRLEIGGGGQVGTGQISLLDGAELVFQLGTADLFLPNKIIGGKVLSLDPVHHVFWDGGTTANVDLLVPTGTNEVINAGTLEWYKKITVFEGGTLTTSAPGASSLSNSVVLSGSVGGTSEVNLSGDKSLVLSGTVSGTGVLLKTGEGVLTLGGTNTFSGGARVREGTLEVVAQSALGSGGFEVAKDGVLALNVSAAGPPMAIANQISGTGVLLKSGSGVVVVSGTENTFSGGTEIGAGTLEIRQTGALGTGQVTIGSTGLLAVNVGANQRVTLNNPIAGDGYLVKEATGVLTVGANSNSFSGTRLEDGILEVGNAAALGRSLMLNGGTLSVLGNTNFGVPVTVGGSLFVSPAAGSVTEISGTFSGNGVLSKTGQGALRLSGNLNVNSGVLEVVNAESGSGGFVKSGAGTLLWSGTGTVRGAAQVQAGTLSVGGDQILREITKVGTGRLEVLGNSKFVGTTVLQAGTTVVDKNAALAEVPLLVVGGKDSAGSVLDVSAVPGGLVIGDASSQTLKGRGAIHGSVEIRSFGVLAPGNSIDVLSAGSILFGQGSTYEVEYLVAGGTVQSDLQRATTAAGGPGTIILNGGVVRPKAMVRLPDMNPHTFQIMAAQRGVLGAFDGAVQTAAIRAELLYADGHPGDPTLLAGTQNTVSMRLNRIPYELLGGSGSARALGARLDRSLTTSDPALGAFIDALDQLPTQPLVQLALGALNPRPFAEVAPLAFARLQDIQKVLGDRTSLLGAESARGRGGPSLAGALQPEHLWSVWTSGYGSALSRKADLFADVPAATSNSFGNLTGVERRFGNALFGILGGGGGSQTQLSLQTAKVSADTWHAGAYSSARLGSRVFLNAAALYGQSDNSLRRTVPFGPADVGALSKIEGREWLTQVGVGAQLTPDESPWRLVPTLQVVHGEVVLESVLESGLGEMGSQTRASKESTTFSRVGVDLAREVSIGSVLLRIGANAAWVRQFETDPVKVEAQLQNGGGETWTVQSAPRPPDALRLGGSVEIDLNDRRRIRVYGEQEFIRGSQIFRGGVTFSFGF